ncbi:glycosyltransferase [Lactiplantibacillus sp. WILCCON 0030]|uniref:Glycosyltransferase n=1 Tax=Lactiplantibacillus brownii TaxID=3069269 RepID=A0ABU1A7P5_9LACO|nr:glycosyltransferase [Lactiplantibacillus brownii]MDQ7936365.1 glycosyltransferase [Lactiplantibacillus brownii]
MYYFLNDNLQYSKSGIEQAEINRLRLFKQHQRSAAIVTRIFSMELHAVMHQAALDDQDVINLFDFFCGSQTVPTKPLMLADFQVPADAIKTRKDRQVQVVQQGKLLMVIYLRGQSDEISNVQYFDVTGKTLKMTWWDTRGMKCLEQFFDWTGKIAQEAYFGPDGQIHLEKLHLLTHAGKERLTWRVLNYRGSSWTFSGLNGLTRFFYDELNANVDDNVFICDRTVECAWGLFNMTTPAHKVLHLHNNHVGDAGDVRYATLNNNYANALNNWDQWDAVISATPQQSEDVAARFGKSIPCFTIPVGYVTAATLATPHVLFNQRQSHLIVQVARLAPEKQQNHSIEAFQQVIRQFPDAKLELWGYANGDTEKALRQQVKAAHLEDSVLFKGYTTDVNAVYNRAQIGLLPSRAEGFSLMLLEAQAHGLPMVANDVKYGPSDIIQDGVSGILTTDGNIQQLADAMLELLSHQDKLAEFSAQAYENATRYSEDAVYQQWQDLLTYFEHEPVTAK